MKTLKLITLIAVFGAAGTALAQYSSPELMLVVDDGSGTADHPAQIERYDPYTGAYLGAFGAGYLANAVPLGIAVIGQEAYVSETINATYSRILKFNFSTGAYDGTIFNTSPWQINGIAAYNGNLLVSDYGSGTDGASSGLYTLSPTGTALGFVAAPANVYDRNVTVVGNTAFVGSTTADGTTSGALTAYSLNPDGTVSGSATTQTSAYGYFGGTSGIAGGQQYYYDSQFDGTNFFLEQRNSSGGELSSYQYGSGEFPWGLATGHNGILYSLNVSYDLSGFQTVDRFDGGSSLFLGPLGSFELTNSFAANNIAIYAAPEPASLAFLVACPLR